ncbi:MAG: hypothetical protein EXS16_03240 [Gemmataceae bacterium]|nr:hypothetical protein [Gemmataceae bacterium]
MFTTRDLAQACRIFLELAYPAGSASIPVAVRSCLEIAPDAAVTDYLPPAPLSLPVCKELIPEKVGTVGFAFRLGRDGYRHLKLRVQQKDHRGQMLWVFSVDTHDKNLLAHESESAAEVERMQAVKKRNAEIKVAIEKAFDRANLLSPTELLRIDLTDES